MSDVPPPPFPYDPGTPVAAPQRGMPGWVVGAVAVVAVLVLLGAIGAVTSKDGDSGGEPAAGPGCGMVTDHAIPEGDAAKHADGPIEYDTAPPHGGKHNPTWLPAFQRVIRRDNAPDLVVERAVHNLEHAYVVVWYGEDVSDEELDEVSEAVAGADLSKVLVVPFPGRFDAPFALTAWGHVQYCEQPDAASLRAFWDLHGGPNGDAPEKNAP